MRDRKFFTRLVSLLQPMSRPSIPSLSPLLFLCLALTTFNGAVLASPATGADSDAASALPNSPGSLRASGEVSSASSDSNPTSAAFDEQTSGSSAAPAPRPFVKLVAAGLHAPPQHASDKLRLGFREAVTPYAMLGWPLSAGWSHLIDSSPNYGTNSEAFAQRLGAAAALNSSKEIFSDAILAAVFHQDPRYYQRGPGHKLLHRTVYAATRPVIGRTDGGRTIPNYAFIFGTGGAAALTRTYYPDRNVSGAQFARTWATSLGGSALGYLVSEFGGEIIQKLRINKHE